VCVSVCASPLSTFECLNKSLLNLVICISWHLNPSQTAYFINLSHPPIVARQRLSKSPPVVARQRLGKNDTAATNIHVIEELLDASFSIRSVSYQRKVGD
jgi:hypothetical protein